MSTSQIQQDSTSWAFTMPELIEMLVADNKTAHVISRRGKVGMRTDAYSEIHEGINFTLDQMEVSR